MRPARRQGAKVYGQFQIKLPRQNGPAVAVQAKGKTGLQANSWTAMSKLHTKVFSRHHQGKESFDPDL
jgi:hypothetical protein